MIDRQARRGNLRAGFTLIEVMIATALTLLLMALVAQVFVMVGNATANTREIIQVSDRMRAAKQTLQSDLSNLTAPMLPPLKPERGKGYFEYIEGPAGPVKLGSAMASNIDQLDTAGAPVPDTTVGDPDDILCFTTRNEERPFYGRYRQLYTFVDPLTGTKTSSVIDGTTQSHYAEVIWFVRGNTLYRRVLLVKPQLQLGGNTAALLSTDLTNASTTYDVSFYDKFDISAHQEGGTYDFRGGYFMTQPVLVSNSLQDLSLRQNRYGHQPWFYPYETRFWGALGMPTMRECTFYTNMVSTSTQAVARWPFPFFDAGPTGSTPPWVVTANLWGKAVYNPSPPAQPIPYPQSPLIYPYPTVSPTNYQPTSTVPSSFSPYLNLTTAAGQYYDAWVNPNPWQQVNQENGAIYAFSSDYQPNAASSSYDGSTRVSDDVILTNVISFDVKAWDPLAPIISDNQTTGNPNSPVPAGSSVYMPGDLGYTQLMTTWASSAGSPAAFQTTVQQHTVGRGAYVDLNYLASVSSSYSPAATAPNMYQAITGLSAFAGPGLAINSSGLGSVYDTGSFTYENDGLDQNGDGIIDNMTNGIDDNGIGGVDDLTEAEGPTPYPVPLKGMQVKIRVFEPDSRQIREVTITEDFLWD